MHSIRKKGINCVAYQFAITTGIKCTQIHPWTEVVYQNLESKNALFYIFDSTGSVFENSEKPLF